MTKIDVQMLKSPILYNPVLVCGLPGSGFVGKVAVEHLITELKAEIFGIIYSYNFPPQVLIRPDGTIDIIKNELYYWKSNNKTHDLIIYTGDSQPIIQGADYEIADRVLEVSNNLGVRKVFTLAAYITGSFVKEPKVYGTGTDIKIIEDLMKHGVVKMSEGTITGMNGLIVGLAKIKGMQGISLLGETSGYIVDANASRAVLKTFMDIMNLEIDMSNLTKRVKNTESLVNTLDQLRKGHEHSVSGTKKEKDLGYIS